ncbi:MAG: serine/threonine-protein kinase [Pirellulaceae bacterium]|nr:serine/threonine-protein kinase [Pirellulaceae bacterium]
MSDVSGRFAQLNQSQLRELDQICADFERDFQSRNKSIESQLEAAPNDLKKMLFDELLGIEIELLASQGAAPQKADYVERFPKMALQIEEVFERIGNKSIPDSSLDTIAVQSPSNNPGAGAPVETIGRFRIVDVLGQGGFGIVYKAHDDQLDREVAIKVPRSNLMLETKIQNAFLEEAKVLAGLDHPHIVPVYEVGTDERFPFFIVSKFIKGESLNGYIKSNTAFHPMKQAALIASLADAAQHAHERGLVHRDIKPANILLDADEQAYLADFGLALKDKDFGKGSDFLGTPAYMSPEQAGGESHRVDGRSDVFSLGTVFYELLCERRPFTGSNLEEIRSGIILCQPKPPRQYRSQIPKELERICLKALSKRTSERYLTAHDMAFDLKEFLAKTTPITPQYLSTPSLSEAQADSGRRISSASNPNSQPISVIPKGLRSFDDDDKDFFLQMLPGVRDKNGLPESIRFWKSRIETRSPENSFSVGLIYGPSGCGKSSLVKAGLLPELAAEITSVYVEASGKGLENNLLNLLRRFCPALSHELDLPASVAALRSGIAGENQRVLIIIDQFEQWLNANKGYTEQPLVQTLRQCDGRHVQCILMVRDEFWLATSRLMMALDINLVPGENIALVDLFDRDHARRVLKLFGRAFGKLPENTADLSSSQVRFLDRAIDGLMQDNTVVCVRLALFAEMFRNREWTIESLKEVGGITGVGEAFMHETFDSRNANPEHRFHREAAQRVLKALLPNSGIDIKGRMKSSQELRELSGYQNQPVQFSNLIRLLDSDLRLITPTEMVAGESRIEGDKTSTQSAHYQLSHDYLVHVLRKWLERKQRETRKGRAELKLEELTELWSGNQQNRYLPSTQEWLGIKALTERKQWTPP